MLLKKASLSSSAAQLYFIFDIGGYTVNLLVHCVVDSDHALAVIRSDRVIALLTSAGVRSDGFLPGSIRFDETFVVSALTTKI